MTYFLFILIGAAAGLLAGLMGIGGGLIIVPALIVLLPDIGINPIVVVHLAIGTSLVSIIFTSLSSVWSHHLQGAVCWSIFRQMTPGIIVGSLVGAVLANNISAEILKFILGVFEFMVAVYMTLNLKPVAQRILPKRFGMIAMGGGIGMISTIAGIGGGTMTVPFLLWCNVNTRKAIATSAACGLPIALAGGVGFVFTGLNAQYLPAYSLGYVYLPVLLAITFSSVVFAPLGVKLAHQIDTKHLKNIFTVFLYISAAHMVFS